MRELRDRTVLTIGWKGGKALVPEVLTAEPRRLLDYLYPHDDFFIWMRWVASV